MTKYYESKPKYEIYFRKKGNKKWFRTGKVYWNKRIGESNATSEGHFEHKLKRYKAHEKR